MSRYIDADLVKGAFQDKYVVYDDTLEIINSVPTADVRENVSGEWILDDSVFGFPKWNCSKCEGEGRGDYLFCPHCGADMMKEKPITKETIKEAIKKLPKIPSYDWREVNFDRHCMSCKHVGDSLGFECAQCESFVMLIGTDIPIAYQPKSLT